MIRMVLTLLFVGVTLLAVACAGEEKITPEPTETVTNERPTIGTTTEVEGTQVPESTKASAASAGQPAVAEGFVFEDLNNNGRYDDIEPGLTGLSIVARALDGTRLVVTTDSEGYFRFEEPFIQHRISVNTGFFPKTFVLTTENQFYDTTVMAGNIASELNFGYRDGEYSSIIGAVYDDLNGNGMRDEAEPGISGVTVLARAHNRALPDATDLTDENGHYRFDFTDIDHEIMVDASTLPAGYGLSSARDVHRLFLPPGLSVFDIDFGYSLGSN